MFYGPNLRLELQEWFNIKLLNKTINYGKSKCKATKYINVALVVFYSPLSL